MENNKFLAWIQARKKLLALIGGGILAFLILAVLIIGLVDGIWPWDGVKSYRKIFKPEPVATVTTAPLGQPGEAPTVQPPAEATENGAGEGQQGTNTPEATTGNPVIDGEPTGTDATVKEEVEIPTQPTPEEGGATEPTRGDTSSATDADASVSGNKIPGWGGGSN